MDDILYTNAYIQNPSQDGGYGMKKELRQEKLRQSMLQPLPEAPRERRLLDNDILKSNPVMTDAGLPKELLSRSILKEKRTIVTIDSNQRKFFTTKDLVLDDIATYRPYLDPSAYEIFSSNWTRLVGNITPVQTYEEYARSNSITIPQIGDTVDEYRSLNLDRNTGNPSDNALVNADLLNLLINIADVNTLSGDLSIINSLNAYTMGASAVDPANFWRPFFWDPTVNGGQGAPKMLVYNEPLPSSYRIVLPNIINHVKSIRLLSTEVPNTINNITERNNLITLYLRYNNSSPTGRAVQLDDTKSIFRFLLIKLKIGTYSIGTLLTHLETQLNAVVKEQTALKLANLFTVTWDANSGAIEIICNRKEIEFHLKFYSLLRDVQEIPVEGGTTGKIHGMVKYFAYDLWYMLGFPWPYEIGIDTKDKYTQLLTNVINFGVHSSFASGHVNDDIFDRTLELVEYPQLSDTTSDSNYLTSSKYTIVNTKRPHRYPSISFKYIFLVLVGYKNISHVNQHNYVADFTEHDFFAKVLLNVDTGKIAFNSFVSNPLIFPNVLNKVEYLDIRWVDERGLPVDFGKVEHSFTLEFIHYITQTDTNCYDSKLGTIDHKSYPEYLAGSQPAYVKLGQNVENNM